MNDEEKKAIEKIEKQILIGECEKSIGVPIYISDLKIVLNLIEKQKAEIEKKYKIQKEVAEEIDNVAVELSKLTDNIFIINQAMKLQKIAEEKLGKFYID